MLHACLAALDERRAALEALQCYCRQEGGWARVLLNDGGRLSVILCGAGSTLTGVEGKMCATWCCRRQ